MFTTSSTIVIVVTAMAVCSAEVYNWNIRAVESRPQRGQTDQREEIKLQADLKSDLQQEQMKLTSKNIQNSASPADNADIRKFHDDAEERWQNQDNQEATREHDQPLGYDVAEFATNRHRPVKFPAKKQQHLHNKAPPNKTRQLHDLLDYNNNEEDLPNDGIGYETDKSKQLESSNIWPLGNSIWDEPAAIPESNHRSPMSQDSKRTVYPNVISYVDELLPHSSVKTKDHNKQQNNDDITYMEEEDGNNAPYEDFMDSRNQVNNRATSDRSTQREFLGSNLFDAFPRKCFTKEDVGLLTIRKDFENLMPKSLIKCYVSDHMANVLVNYFNACHRIIRSVATDDLQSLVLKGYFDALGGYLNYHLMPVAKFSYYAGQLGVVALADITDLKLQCQSLLNTQGMGWRSPPHVIPLHGRNIYIKPLDLAEDEFGKNDPLYCLQLAIDDHRNASDKLLVPLPKLEPSADDSGFLGNIWLPFRRKRVYDLKSYTSAYVLLRFYDALTRCHLYHNLDQQLYNKNLKLWIQKNIYPHLTDDIVYPGLGAILQVYVTLQPTAAEPQENANFWESEPQEEEAREKRRNHKYGFRYMKPYKPMDRRIEQPDKEHDRNEQREGVIDSKYSEKDLNAPVGVPDVPVENADSSGTILGQLTPIKLAAIIGPIVLLLIIVLVCCIVRRRRQKKKQVRLGKPEEETHLLKASSKSVLHGSMSSSSSMGCQLPAKCFSIRRKGPAIVETTSMDITSSEVEDEAIKGARSKMTKVNEKSGQKKNAKDDKDKKTKDVAKSNV